MRDLDRWKDKVELQLDGRQVFFLFFGSAICACLIFVLGVVVGKRVEARTAAQSQSAADDPLAALDELGNAEEGLTFHSALTGDKGRKGRTGKPGEETGEHGAAREEGARPEGRTEVRAAAFLGVNAAAVAGLAVEAAEAVSDKPAAVAARPAVENKPGAAVAAVAPKPGDKPAAKPAAESKPAVAAVAAKPSPGPAAVVPPKGHFTLQLSAFTTKAEATEFLKRLRDAGYKPYISESVVPGKGLMFRVRLGDFTSHDTALSAKGDFEKKQKIVAYVAKL